MKTVLANIVKTVPAGQIIHVAVTGTIVNVLDADQNFSIQLGLSGDELPIVAGLTVPLYAEDTFTQITIDNSQNPSSDLHVSLYVGNVEVVDRRPVKFASTILLGNFGLNTNGTYNSQSITIDSSTGVNLVSVSPSTAIKILARISANAARQSRFQIPAARTEISTSLTRMEMCFPSSCPARFISGKQIQRVKSSRNHQKPCMPPFVKFIICDRFIYQTDSDAAFGFTSNGVLRCHCSATRVGDRPRFYSHGKRQRR
jgi:hypothetical protein